MPDFDKALQSMKAADLAYIQRVTNAPSVLGPDTAPSRKRHAKRVNPETVTHNTPHDIPENTRVPTPEQVAHAETAQDKAARDKTTRGKVTRDQTRHDQTIPDATSTLGPVVREETAAPRPGHPERWEAPPTNAAVAGSETTRTRRAVPHEWPPVGAILTATYFGTVYRVEVVDAKKRLKSGRQLRLLDGPSKGRRFDSLSKAMLVATAKQRREQKLGRKGASNGWSFWQAAPIAAAKSPGGDA